jgi:hypothetical protein
VRRPIAVITALAITLSLPSGAVRGAENMPPVAIDDPSPACGNTNPWGGSYPIPEDWIGFDKGFPGWSPLMGACAPMANDSDPDGDPLTFELVGQPAHGTAVSFANDFAAYDPDPDFSTLPGDQEGGSWVSDTITYRVFDGSAYSNAATYRIWVAPINDPPTFVPGSAIVEAFAYGTPVEVPWARDVSPGPANEADQTVSFDVETDTRNAPGMFVDPPAIDHAGTLTFTPGTEPGLALITVTAHDDGGMGTWGLDGGGMDPPDDTSDPVTFEIVVWPALPAAPVAADDTLVVSEDGVGDLEVLANDTDINGDPIVVESVDNGSKGSAMLAHVPGTIRYTPDPDATGADSFRYTVDDGKDGSSTATVAVTITPVNDEPVAADDAVTVAEGSDGVLLDVLGNDTDVDGDSLAVSAAGPAGHGTVVATGGVVHYTPDPGFTGTDRFHYTVTDGHGATASASVSIAVALDTSPPAIGTRSRSIPLGAIGTSTMRVRLGWSAMDAVSGVAHYTVEERRDGGAWRPVPLTSATSRSVVRALGFGTSYEYRVRATDGRGNVSGWAAWSAFTPTRREERSSLVHWAGRWTRAWYWRLSGGRSHWAAAAGRSASLTFTGHGIGWVGRQSPTSGSARIYVDGVLVGTVSSRARTVVYRAVLYSTVLAAGGRHQIVIRPVGNGRVDVDAFVILP